MKRKFILFLSTFLCLLNVLNSCSGHIVPAEPTSQKEEPSLLPVSSWESIGSQKSHVVFCENGLGSCNGIPFSWNEENSVVTVKYFPGCCVGREEQFKLRFQSGRAVLHLGKLEYIQSIMQKHEKPKPAAPEATPKLTLQELIAAEGQEAANLCFAQIGQKYKYGGKSPETGFDCSGLVYYVYSQLGYTLERVANYQAKQGILIDEENMQPGDLLCFGAPGYVGHIGVYVGNRYYIHAMGEAYGVVATSLDDPYIKRTYEVRRIAGCDWLKSENVAAGMSAPNVTDEVS